MTIALAPACWRGAVGAREQPPRLATLTARSAAHSRRSRTVREPREEVGHVLRKSSRRRQGTRPTVTIESRIEVLAVSNHIDLKFACLLSREANRSTPAIRA